MKQLKEGIFTWKKTIATITAVNLTTMVFTYLELHRIPSIVPLYYGNPTGAEQLGPVSGLFIPPSFVLVSLVTAILINKAYKNDFLESLLILSLSVLTVFSTVTIFKILFLVGNL